MKVCVRPEYLGTARRRIVDRAGELAIIDSGVEDDIKLAVGEVATDCGIHGGLCCVDVDLQPGLADLTVLIATKCSEEAMPTIREALATPCESCMDESGRGLKMLQKLTKIPPVIGDDGVLKLVFPARTRKIVPAS